ncbi:hypothetical protein [Bacillus sp. FJAT-50079]|uniref:hypothetical protein n=1 Tax=Bacillus sp. FJAT-50079 TaxID=2833577 RepID=UPI001BC97A13|nr:hypothetical protein [Bacillus sp. FJAT-50079]MBS4206910.1 hypothetical protein [Bacillus sp. FJAT-50079]
MYAIKDISDHPKEIHRKLNQLSNTNKFVIVATLSGLSAIFQAAGGLLPGVGFFISPLATAPIILCSIVSFRYGFISYLLSILLLLILQPAELIIFPFTTGLLGIGLGAAFLKYKKRLSIVISGCLVLVMGISTVLYVFKFPLLGPAASTSFTTLTALGIILFSTLYSWIWVEISSACFKRIKVIIFQ